MHCIGVDVSKQQLVTFAGKTERIFPNDRSLPELRRFVNRTEDVFIVFEPTSTYSRKLETLCRTNHIVCCQLNPRVVPHLRQWVEEDQRQIVQMQSCYTATGSSAATTSQVN